MLSMGGGGAVGVREVVGVRGAVGVRAVVGVGVGVVRDSEVATEGAGS